MRTPVDGGRPRISWPRTTSRKAPVSVLTDVSGHRNHGLIRGATWTTQGRSGSALDFADARAAVVIPHSSFTGPDDGHDPGGVDLPDGGADGLASDRAEGVRHVLPARRLQSRGRSSPAGAVPSVRPRRVWRRRVSSRSVRGRTWRVTYDGAVLQLYIDGRPMTRRLRWYPGRSSRRPWMGWRFRPGSAADSPQLRDRLLSGAPVRVRAVAAAPVPSRAPLVTLQDAVEKRDPHARRRRRRSRLSAADPGRGHAASKSSHSSARVSCAVSRRATPWMYGSDTSGAPILPRRQRPIDVRAWLLARSRMDPASPTRKFRSGGRTRRSTLGAMAALLFPFGFWIRRRWESALGGLVLASCLGVLTTIGNLNASWDGGDRRVRGGPGGEGVCGGDCVVRLRRICAGAQIGSVQCTDLSE